MFSNFIKIMIAQTNFLVGDIENNTNKIITQSKIARESEKADIIIFPELSLTGYPPEDLLLRPSLHKRINQSLSILFKIRDIVLIIGAPIFENKGLKNKALAIYNGKIIASYAKQNLPNYAVFDEKRYFIPGDSLAIFEYKSIKFGLSICEDLWCHNLSRKLHKNSVDCILSLNASPFHHKKTYKRQEVISQRSKETNLPIIYVNLIGGQDELVFDGGSFITDNQGNIIKLLPYFEESLNSINFDIQQKKIITQHSYKETSENKLIYDALVLSVRDYVNKNRFNGVLLGLSGGIDSALTLAIAVDALGKEKIKAIMMPFHYTAKISIENAEKQAHQLGVEFSQIPIQSIYNTFIESLKSELNNAQIDETEENLQSRCRGNILMTISNKHGYLLLTTGNKSEMSVGYTTLYGDMCGGFNPLKDVIKTKIYQLANYRNSVNPVIPQRVIDRPPSAELAPNQFDSDTLPPYDQLDFIINEYIEHDKSANEIIKTGIDKKTVYKIITLIDKNEFKRRQAVIGPRITEKSFGKDRRYPITNGWKAGV